MNNKHKTSKQDHKDDKHLAEEILSTDIWLIDQLGALCIVTKDRL